MFVHLKNYSQLCTIHFVEKRVSFSISTKTCEFSEQIYFFFIFMSKKRRSKSIFTHQLRKTGWRMFFFFNLFKYPFVSAFQKRFVDDKSENNLKFNLNQNCLRMILSVGVGMKFNKFEFVNV